MKTMKTNPIPPRSSRIPLAAAIAASLSVAHALNIDTSTGDVTLAATTIVGTDSLTVTGPNTVYIGGYGTFTGDVNINEGTVSTSTSQWGGNAASSSLGTLNVARTIYINTGGTLLVNYCNVPFGEIYTTMTAQKPRYPATLWWWMARHSS